PPPPAAPSHPQPAPRVRRHARSGRRVGREEPGGRRSLRAPPDVRSGDQRSPPERARILPRGAASPAREGEADRVADAALRDAPADRSRRPPARRAHRRSALADRLYAGGDRRARAGGRGPDAPMTIADEILFEV